MRKPTDLLLRLLLCAFAATLSLRAAEAEADALIPLRAAMRAGLTAEAIALAENQIAAAHPKADEAHYLKALALLHAKKYAKCAETAGGLVEAFPKSKWIHKAVFLKAQALVEQKKFKEAAEIYQGEAERILSAGRKEDLVGVIAAFAAKLTAKPDPNLPDAPQPDFEKAYGLYTKALGMEISRPLRDELLFRKARAIQQAGNAGQALQDLQAYLTEFDPAWTGPAGSGTPRLPMQVPPPAGKHVAEARFHLAEAQIQAGNAAAGRMELEDLLKLNLEGAAALVPEIRWLMVKSHVVQPEEAGRQVRNFQFAGNANSPGQTIGNTGGLPAENVNLFALRDGDLDAAMKTCRDYLAAYPQGSRAVRAAWMIAEGYESAGRADDAITAYRDFIAGKGFGLPEGEAAQKFDEEIRAAPATHLANLRMRAVFRVGAILGRQKKHAEAISTWQGYVKDYPNGPQWAESQNAIINAEFQMGMDALAAEDEALALNRFNAFLAAHPLDERSPRILYLFGAVHEARAAAMEKAKGDKALSDAVYRKAIEEWSKLVSKYPQSPEARIALLKSGGLHEETFGEFEKALHIYRKLAEEFGFDGARVSTARLTQKSLDLSAERTFRTNEKAVVKLVVRNMEKVTFRLHKIDLQAYFRKMHGITGVEGLDVSLIQPDKTWEFKPEGYTKYKPFTQEVEIPFPAGEPGAYVVTAGDDEWESTVLVLRSDLEVIVKSSRREVLAFVQDMLTGKPAAGVDILVSDGKAVAATGKTGADGVFTAALDSLKDLGDVRLFALGKGHAASFNLNLEGLQRSSGLTAKGYLYTDRPVYQPGETVALRGILREVRDTAYALPENSEFKLSITDPQGRLLSEQTVKLGRFGTFDASLALPAAAASGPYVLAARQERKGREALHFQGSFEVRTFKLEKIKLALEFPRRVWFRGEKIEATLQTAYYWGEPLAGRTLRCTLPDGRTQSVTTDAEGRATLSFDTTGMRPGSALTFTAALDGEALTATETVTLARLGFGIQAKPSQPVVIAGEPFDLTVTTTGADGKPSGETLKLEVLRIEQPKASPVLALLPWPNGAPAEAAEVKESVVEIKTDAATGKATVALKLEKGGLHRLRTTGTDRFGQVITHQCEVRISDASDATKLRLFADSATLKVGQDASVRLHSRVDKGLALVTFEGETILRHQIIELKKDSNWIAVKVGHELFPNFRLAVAAMDGRDLREAAKDFSVERELKVVVKPLKESFLPGEAGQVELTVTDQTGQPVEAELSLALVNEALFAVSPDTLAPILDFFQQDARRHAEFKLGATCAFQYAGTTRGVSKEVVAEAGRRSRSELERDQIADLRKTMRPAEPPAARPVVVNRLFNFEVGNVYSGVTTVSGGTLSGLVTDESSAADRDELKERQSELTEQTANKPSKGERKGRGEGEASTPPRREVRGEGRWLPSVITGKDGKAVVTVPMPETTTAWRLTARGCTVETLVGQATARTLTRKEFFVELKAPTFLREGDQIRVVGRVHNLTDYAGPVALKLRLLDSADPTKVVAEIRKSVEVKAKDGAEVAFDAATIPALLDVTLELSGTAGPHKDALSLPVPVRPWGLPYAAQAGGTANADTAAVVGLPGGRQYGSIWMSISVGPDLQSALFDMALRSDGSQGALARLQPPAWGDHPAYDLLSAASALAYANRGKADDRITRPLADRARALVATLVATQDGNGGWTSNFPGHAIPSWSFWALITARDAGIPVHKETLEKAAALLLKQLEGLDVNDNDNKAILLHALSCDKRADFAACNRLYRDRNALGTTTLAYLTRTFHNIGRAEIAAELAGILEGKAKRVDGQPVAWESGYKLVYLNDPAESTALVLLALAEVKPESALVEPTAQTLLNDRGCFGFPGARARGAAVAALSAWFGKGREQATDLEIAIVVNGKEVGRVTSARAQGLTRLDVAPTLLNAEKNVVEFKMKGRGRYAYAATLTGFSSDTRSTADNVRPSANTWHHRHAPLEYRGKPLGVASTSPVKNIENGQRVSVELHDRFGHWNGDRWHVLDIPLPAGARLVEGSVTVDNNFKAEVLDDSIRVYFHQRLPAVRYEITGYTPGTFRLLPPVVREVGNSGFMSVGPSPVLTVLATGEKSPDPYEMNIDEHFALGRAHFNDGELATALEHLTAVRTANAKYSEQELARMLLWIHTTPKFYDARAIVDLFEILRERYPNLEIPFDRILVVGRAYTDIGEFERSWLVFRAAIAASFINDSSISAVLEDAGRFLGSIDFQERIAREYPDTADVVSSHFALSQLLYQKAPNAHELPKEDGVQPERIAMLKRTADMLLSFLAMFPRDPLADDAAFSLANCVLTLKNYPLTVSLSAEFAARYHDSPMAPGLQYVTALGLFWQNKYGEALAAARIVADGDSKDRDFARYILGQIFHAESKPKDAITWYTQVKELYPDAAEAIAYFEKKCIALDEITEVKPGQPVDFTLTYRNIQEAFLQVYRVDLMKLYLQQKNLSAITSVQLAGIRPELEKTLALGDGKDYVEKEVKVSLDLKDEAAYLVICRGDDLFTSGMVLITPLKVEVQEDGTSGRVRANVLDTVKGGYRPEVHVKAIGSADTDFRGGETDLRGLFIADNIRGKATVIAREGESRYAFFRGDAWLGAPENAPAVPAKQEDAKQALQIDYQGNLNLDNGLIQQFNNAKFNSYRRQAPNKGVQMKAAY